MRRLLPFTDCTVMTQTSSAYICMGREEKKIQGYKFTLGSKLFPIGNGQMGTLLFNEYIILEKEQCLTQEGDISHFLSYECCQQIESSERVYTACPYFLVENPPSFAIEGGSVIPQAKETLDVHCLNGEYSFESYDSLLTDCTIRDDLTSTLKLGYGTFLSDLPETTQNSLSWKDGLLIALASIALLLIICLTIIITICLMRKKRTAVPIQQNFQFVNHPAPGPNVPMQFSPVSQERSALMPPSPLEHMKMKTNA